MCVCVCVGEREREREREREKEREYIMTSMTVESMAIARWISVCTGTTVCSAVSLYGYP